MLEGPPSGWEGADEALAAWLDGCPGWSDRYGRKVNRWTRCSRVLECPGGGEFGFFTLAPQRALDRLADEGFPAQDLKALQQQRCEDATALVECP